MGSKLKYIFTIFILLISINKVNALSVSKNNLTIEKGGSDSVELYANTDKEVTAVDFTLVYTTYDVPANFIVNNSYTDGNPDGITHRITFPEATSGKILLGTININVKSYPNDRAGTINIHSAKATTSEGETISLDAQNINVTIGTPEPSPVVEQKEEPKVEEPKEEPKQEETNKNLLDKIESNIVKIKLKKDVFEYSISIDPELTELDLKPVAKDEDTNIDITTQKISEIEDNKITITATKGDIKQEYIINIKNKKDTNIEVDTTEFKGNTNYKGKWIIVSIVLIVILMISLLSTKKK